MLFTLTSHSQIPANQCFRLLSMICRTQAHLLGAAPGSRGRCVLAAAWSGDWHHDRFYMSLGSVILLATYVCTVPIASLFVLAFSSPRALAGLFCG